MTAPARRRAPRRRIAGEVEIEPREPERGERESGRDAGSAGVAVRRRSVSLWGGLISALLIAGSSAIVLYAGYLVWTM